MKHVLDSSIIATRLRSLREERKLSRNNLADGLLSECNQSLTVESIRKYESYQNTNNGDPPNTVMSVKNLHALADFYEVSTDYILGRTDIKSSDTSIRAIVEYTGLTEESVLYLHQLKVGDSEETFLDNVVSILEHDFTFRIKSDPTRYEMFDEKCGHVPEKTPGRKRQAQIMTQHERRKYIQGLSNALRKCPIYTLNAINTLLCNNSHLHLLEEIGKYISADPDDLNDRYPTSVSQTSAHYTGPQHITGDTKELLIERRLSIITQKLEQLREIALGPME